MGILPVSIQLEGWADFSLQLNKKISGRKMKDLEINRLCRWSVNQVHQFTVPAFGFPLQSVSTQGAATFYVAQQTLDINTAAAGKTFAGSASGRILAQLRDEIDAVRRGTADQQVMT